MAERTSQYPVESIIINRWSPRAMSAEAISEEQLMTIFEAARWAQSASNSQPWRFVYGMRGTAAWDRLFSLLVPFNQEWVKNGAVLMLVVSQNNFSHNGKPSVTHSFDTGAACQNLALQAYAMGLVAHGMGGFDYQAARKEFSIPDNFTVEAMFVVGRPASSDVLSKELQAREVPSDRKPITDFAFNGEFVS